MKYIVFLSVLMSFSCEQPQAQQAVEAIQLPVPKPVIYEPTVDYETYLTTLKSTLKQSSAKNEDIKTLLFTALNKEMPAYWKGTTWDFNGVSTVPGEGEIACGYYVTTPLKQLGFPIKRFWLAQQASAIIVGQLTVSRKRLSSIDAVLEYVNAQPSPSIFVVGLDFHTGFITNGPEGTFFIHSNYINREGVVKEKLIDSDAFAHSEAFVVGNLSENEALLERWQNNLN